jgi:hypothetical protein
LTARLLIVIGCAVAALAALAPAAGAAPAPSCSSSEIWSRPGLERQHRIACEDTDAVVLVGAPQHGRLAGFRWDGEYAHWSFAPEAGAPETDAIELQLTGPGGAVVKHLDINVVPLGINTAPTCLPLADARRSDGLAPVELQFSTYCSDAEHDGMTLDGGGPGVHLDAPRFVPGGHSWTLGVMWRYRTATVDGAESATYWAIDDLGARSEEAPISVAVGPGIDRLPACRMRYGDPYEIRTRPGATRNFGLACEDADGDRFTTRVGIPPQHGAFTTFAADPPLLYGNGTFGLLDITYVPAAASLIPDSFTVIAETAPARRSETPMTIVPSALPENGFGTCGWSNRFIRMDEATNLLVECADLEGDALQAEITSPPDHGTAEPPAILPGRFGDQQVVVRYVPAPGYSGRDSVGITVSDGSLRSSEMRVPIEIFRPSVPRPSRPVSPGTGRPAVGQPPAIAPADQARAALQTTHVRLLRRAGVARIYAAKGRVRMVAGAPALAVTCDLPCLLEARAVVGRRATGRQRMTIRPSRAGVVKVSRGAARRARAAAARRLRFALKIGADGRAARRVSVALRTRGR